MTNHSQLAGHFVARWAMRLVAHGLGICVVAVLVWLPFLNQFTFNAILESFHHFNFVQATWWSVGVHMGLAGCLWALGVILFEVITGRRQPAKKALRLQRGSVLTETLLVLPVFLLLTFGLAQLAVNNIAGIVTNAAAFQAGRTYWLWASEADGSRGGATLNLALEKARTQAAAVLTPVAPGQFEQGTGGLSASAIQKRGTLMGSQKPDFSTDAGATGITDAETMIARHNTGSAGMDTSFTRALGTRGYRDRTARQFTFAYHASDIARTTGPGDELGISLTYWHLQAFPLVARIFGEAGRIGERDGIYMKISREFTMPAQIPPNPRVP